MSKRVQIRHFGALVPKDHVFTEHMKIAANDATLAHALAKREADRQVRADIASIKARYANAPRPTTMKAAFRELRSVFKGRVVHEVIEREKGSRARGMLFILEPISRGALVLFVMSWVKGNMKQYDTPIVVSKHALARMMQRTVGESDLQACCDRLKPYVVEAAMDSLDKGLEYAQGKQMTVAGQGGALVFRTEDRLIIARTWMDTGMMADPVLRVVSSSPLLTVKWEKVEDEAC